MRRFLLVVVLLTAFALPASPRPASAAQAVATIEMDSAITPVTVRLLTTAIDRAQSEGAQALVVQLNTPGGLSTSSRPPSAAVRSRMPARPLPLPEIELGVPPWQLSSICRVTSCSP